MFPFADNIEFPLEDWKRYTINYTVYKSRVCIDICVSIRTRPIYFRNNMYVTYKEFKSSRYEDRFECSWIFF